MKACVRGQNIRILQSVVIDCLCCMLIKINLLDYINYSYRKVVI